MNELSIMTVNARGVLGKLPHLQNLIHTHQPDFLFLQETNIKDNYIAQKFTHNLGLSKGIFSLGNFCRGTAILQTSNRWKIIKETTDNTLGRITTATITNKSIEHTLVNIYSPSQRIQRPHFYKDLANRISSVKNNIILAGDFNITLEDRDITGTDIGELRYGREELRTIIESHNLKDSYREINNSTTDTTHKNVGINRSARIDRIYVNKSQTVSYCKHIDSTLEFTDHKAVLTKINSSHNKTKQPSPHWILNDTLLNHPDYIQSIKNTISAYIQEDDEDPQNTWEQLKIACKRVSVIKSVQINRARRDREKELELLIEHEHNQGNQNETHTLNLQTELEEIRQHRYNGAKLRTQFKHIIDEKPTQEYLSLETSIQKSRHIDQINDKHGNLQTEPQDIVNAFYNFYKELYTKEETDSEIQDFYMQFTQKLTDEQRDNLDTELTPQIFKQGLNMMGPHTTPGADGLSTLFYQTFFDDLSPLYMAMIKDNFRKEILTPSQYLGYISLIPKDSDNPLDIQNFRPISLLNLDYKILTKALTIKASQIIAYLIHTDQTSGVKGRNIQQHNHFIRDIISLANDKQTTNLILSLDLTKAFDRVDHTFLHKVLEHCNFGPYFRKWIQIIYKHPVSAILINKTLSDTFTLTRSLRQGDSLSPLLYILTLEPLLTRIRQDKRISGIFIPGGGVQKLLAFADDTNFFPADFRSVKLIFETFKHFGRGSGSEINESKSQALAIGKWESKANDPFRLNYVTEIKIFGIYYKNTRNQNPLTAWKKLVEEIKNLISKLYFKVTSIFGRSVLVNTLVYPKILYHIQTLDAPADTIKEINKCIREFIFKGTFRKIRHSTLIQHKINGGINLQDIETKTKALRIQYIKNIIQNKDTNILAHFYVGTRITNLTPLDNKKPHYFGTLPQFYSTCITNIRQYIEQVHTTKTTKDTYKAIIKTKLTPLHDQIKRARQYGITDFSPIFQNLHIQCTTPIQKQIMYRLLFLNTPLTNPTSTNIPTCKTCRQRKQETEEHIFYECQSIQKTKQSLKKLLNTQLDANVNTDIYKAIFLNLIPPQPHELHLIKLHILAIYRDTLWKVRLENKFSDRNHTPKTILDMFTHKLTHALTKQNQWAAFERMIT